MRLKLLAFFLLWVTTINADSVQTPSTNCLHDGYPDPNDTTKCLCRDGLFTGQYCQNRIIYNDGVIRRFPNATSFDIGAICPPGFIGANCQSVKCVPGQSQAFYTDPQDQMVSYYITYNLNMQVKAYNDSVLNAICQGFDDSQTSQFLFYTPAMGRTVYRVPGGNATAACITSFNTNYKNLCADYDDNGNPIPDNCPGSDKLDLDLLNDLLDKTIPNSELYLVTNYPANDTSKIPLIIRKAISRRIRIHAFAFPTPEVMSENDYVNAPGYQALRTLAESTLGIFATPYAGVHMNTLGTSTVSDSITAMMNLRKEGFVPAGVFSTASSRIQQVRIGDGSIPGAEYKYYISIRTEDIASNDGDFPEIDFVRKPDGWDDKTVAIDTGNWKLYMMTTNITNIFFAQNTTKLKTHVDWVLYTQYSPVLFTAVNDPADVKGIDAGSPYGNLANGSLNLIVHAVGKDMSSVDVTTAYTPAFTVPNNSAGVVAFNSAFQSRDGCQFSSTLGNVRCTGEGTVFIQTSYKDGSSSVSPFFCMGAASSQQTEMVIEIELEDDITEDLALDEIDAATCTNNDTAAPFAEKTASRAFAIVSRNVRYTVGEDGLQAENYSPVDRLYWNPGNIFEYLNMDELKNYYAYYISNLVTNSTARSLTAESDYSIFVNKLMAKTNDLVAVNETDPVDWYTAINETIWQLAQGAFDLRPTYSDILVVIDMDDISSINNKDSYWLFKGLYTTRSRLYFLTVDSDVNTGFQPNTVSEDDVARLSLMAAQTGGGLYRFDGFDNLMEFFKLYFDQTGNGLLGADVVYQKMYEIPNVRQIQTGNITFPETLVGNNVTYWLHLYATTNILSSTSSCGASLVSMNQTWGEQQRYMISGVTGSPCNFSISFIPYSLGTSFIIYAVGTSTAPLPLSVSIAFTDSIGSELASDPTRAALLQFGSQQPQYPVLSIGIPVTFAINSPDQEIYSTDGFNLTNCGYFPNRVDYDFRCSAANSFYFFYTTFNDGSSAIHTRTYVTRCLSPQLTGACANGVEDENGNCICPPGFTGAVCNERVCQNGGNLLPSGLCNCTIGFTGEFCEISSLNCMDSPTLPDTRSEVSSIIFVVDNTLQLNKITGDFITPSTLPGIQITVIQYDNTSAQIVLLGTDPLKLTVCLKASAGCLKDSDTGTSDDPVGDAIMLALNSQISPRALLVLVTNGTSPFLSRKTEILAKLAAQRTDIRIFAFDDPHPDLQFLATLGNGIVFQGGHSSFVNYFNNYVWNVVPRSLQLTNNVIKSIPRLSVVQTGVADQSFTLTLPKDAADTSAYTVYFFHTNTSAIPDITGGEVQHIVGGTNSNIRQIDTNGNSISIKIESTGSTHYSIEKMTTVLLGYGFADSGINEYLNPGLTAGVNNALSFYTSRSTLYDSMDSEFPYVTLNEIMNDTTIGLPVNYAVTRKNQSCIYNYYTIPIRCSDTTVGYVAQFVTYTQDSPSEQRKEQKIILCASSGDYTTPAPPTTPATTIPTTTIPTTTTPETTTPTQTRAYAFIIDTRGGDPNLFAIINETVNDFLKAYSPDLTSIFLTDQQGAGTANGDENTFVANDPKNVKNAFDVFAKQRMLYGDNNFTNPTPAFNAIKTAFGNSNGVYAIKEMLYLTQTGVYYVDSDAVQSLKDIGFSLSAALYIATLPTTDTENRLQSITSNLINPYGWSDPGVVNNTKVAVKYFVDNAQPPTFYTVLPIPTQRQYACVKKAQASIYLSYEISNTTGIIPAVDPAVLNKTYFEFLQLFPSDFELGDTYNISYYANYTSDKDFCRVNTSRFDAQTLLSGWGFRDQTIATQNAMPCYNNLPSLGPYINMPSRAKSNSPLWWLVSTYVNLTLSNPCKCNRLDDPNTLKVVVWLPFSAPTAADKASVGNLTDTNPFVHIILALGPAADDPNDFYTALAQKSIQKAKDYGYTGNLDISDFFMDARNKPTKDLVSFVYEKICMLQKIEGTTTPTGGNSEYFEEFWRQAALHPEMLIRGIEENGN